MGIFARKKPKSPVSESASTSTLDDEQVSQALDDVTEQLEQALNKLKQLVAAKRKETGNE